MNNKIIISSLVVIVLVVAGVLTYNLAYKKPPMTSNTVSNNRDIPENDGATNTTPSSTTPAKPPLTELQVVDTVEGTGAAAAPGDEITVHYTGKLNNDIVFDSSYIRNQPFVFTLGVGMVIQGWDQGMVGMKIGGKRTLAIPAPLAYGASQRGSIPPNSDLYFEVELLSIKGKK